MLTNHLAFGLASIATILAPFASAELSGSVGPLTTAAEKAAVKTCNVLDYGAVADNSTDVGQPIIDAFADCGSGGLIYVPEGNYSLQTWVSLSDGNAWALQIDGVLWRGASPAGQSYMLEISGGSDFELFSSNSAGAIQASGYLYHINGTYIGPRVLHVDGVSDWSVHDFILVDSPMFHFVIEGGSSNGEVYNMAIRGGDSGGLDGIDVSAINVWIHDVTVTNKDECVTTKTGSKNLLIESIYCNISGGCAMGSLGAGANVSDITYRNIYTLSSNQMFMFKSNGGSGEVKNVVLENFIGHNNAYSLDLDSFWSSMSAVDGDGVSYSNITFSNWKGDEEDGETRPPIQVICPPEVPCTDITVQNVDIAAEAGGYIEYLCENAYGSGYCVSNSTDTTATYTTTLYASPSPSGYSAPTMAADLTAGFGVTLSIPIPTIPTSFYPGVTPKSALAGSS
ncbi:hypothetical protein N7540_005893 [Penicillium herquei]|nr:hypothetical protein N7540_005893 [Penicillium herquei]